MLYLWLEQIISLLGTVIAVLAVRWLMELSSPQEDMRLAGRVLDDVLDQWEQGTFSYVVVWYRARKLLDW